MKITVEEVEILGKKYFKIVEGLEEIKNIKNALVVYKGKAYLGRDIKDYGLMTGVLYKSMAAVAVADFPPKSDLVQEGAVVIPLDDSHTAWNPKIHVSTQETEYPVDQYGNVLDGEHEL